MNIQKTILGCILLDYSIHDIVFPLLKVQYFTEKERQLFELMQSMLPGKIDTITVNDKLNKTDIGWSPLDVVQLQDGVAGTANVLSYIQVLKNEYIERQLQYEFDVKCNGEPTQKLREIAIKIDELQNDSVIAQPDSLVDICELALDEIENEHKSVTIGMMSPLGSLNSETKGFRKGELVVIAGRPGMGKTAFALATVKRNCHNLKRIAYFTMEMRSVELVKRLIRSYKKPDEGAGEVSKYDLHIFDKGGIDTGFIKSTVRVLKNVDMIVVDYLQLMRTNNRVKRFEAIGEITRDLKSFSLEMEIPILLLSQLNRGVEDRSTWRHKLSDLRESGDIEQDADKVMFIIVPKKLGLDIISINGKEYETDKMFVIQKEKDRNGRAPVFYQGYHNESFTEFYEDESDPF